MAARRDRPVPERARSALLRIVASAETIDRAARQSPRWASTDTDPCAADACEAACFMVPATDARESPDHLGSPASWQRAADAWAKVHGRWPAWGPAEVAAEVFAYVARLLAWRARGTGAIHNPEAAAKLEQEADGLHALALGLTAEETEDERVRQDALPLAFAERRRGR